MPTSFCPHRTTFSLSPHKIPAEASARGRRAPAAGERRRRAGWRELGAGAAPRAAEGSRVRRLPEVRGEEAKKSRRGRGRASARAGCGRGREGRTGTGTRARACGCLAAPSTAGGLLRPPRALPREPQDPASRPCVPSRRGRRRPPGPVLPGRVRREPPAPRGNRRLPARRGGATAAAAAAAFADRGRARASEGWGAARGAERPGSCHLRLRNLLPRRSCSSRHPEPGGGRRGRREGSPGPGPWSRARLTRGGPRRGRDRGHERPAAPDRKQKPAGPGSAAGICRPPRPRRGAHPAPDGLLRSVPRAARRLPSVTKFSPALSQGSLPSFRPRLLADLLGLFGEITCFAPTRIPSP